MELNLSIPLVFRWLIVKPWEDWEIWCRERRTEQRRSPSFKQNWICAAHLESIEVGRSKVVWITQSLVSNTVSISPDKTLCCPPSSIRQLSQLLNVTEVYECVCVCVWGWVSVAGFLSLLGWEMTWVTHSRLLSHSRCFSTETQVSCLRSFRLHKNTASASAPIDDAVRPLSPPPHTHPHWRSLLTPATVYCRSSAREAAACLSSLRVMR